MLRGDAGRLRQVLLNLLGNAVKFTETGTVAIRVSAKASEPTELHVMLHIEVEDTGIGIRGDLARLFEPFAQVSPTTGHDGTGLGLGICAQLVAAMGGTITAESQPDSGSIFRVDIPFAVGAAPRDAATSPPALAEPGEEHKHRGRVLVVDDNGINRLITTQMVGRLGYSSDTANTGAEALKMLGARRYVAVLMDCFMPVMDGFDATTELRLREGSKRHTAVIATTAGALDGDRADCEAAGMDDYVSKPLSLDLLEAALGRWVSAA
jgi:CheY-like chemotaxis protein